MRVLKIVNGGMETQVVHDEEGVIAKDINARAPVHVLIVPKENVSSLARMGRLPDGMAKRLFEVAHEVSERLGVDESGYAYHINNGPDAGQEVFHLHAHVMDGRKLRMP